MEVTRHVQSTHNRKLVIFLQYLKKKIATAFVFYYVAKHSDTLRGSSRVHFYLLLVKLVVAIKKTDNIKLDSLFD